MLRDLTSLRTENSGTARLTPRSLLLLGVLGITLSAPPPGRAATVYVDAQIGSGSGDGSCADYDPATRSCGSGGAALAFASLEDGVPAATLPGDEVRVRAGTYSEPLIPAASGAPGQPILFGAYPGEEVVGVPTSRATGGHPDPSRSPAGSIRDP